ncbi:acyltransferase [Clostridium perfringens]|nr:acyltransferase [Clostridium perfringens]
MDITISKSKSNAIKVVAILFMVIYHTFAFKGRISNVSYISIYKLTNTVTIEYFLSRFGGVCVQIFLFLSGYGLYQKYNRTVTYSDIIKKVKRLLINYWVILLMFFPIGVILGKYTLNIKQFIMNFLTLSSSYNREWWFLKVYIILILMYPIILKIINKFNLYSCLILSMILNIVGMTIIKIELILSINLVIVKSIIASLSNVLTQQFVFILGILVAKYAIFDKFNYKLGLNKSTHLVIAFAIVLINTIGINIHFFQNIAFMPKFSILIILWILLLSLITSTIVNYILKLIYSINEKYSLSIEVSN